MSREDESIRVEAIGHCPVGGCTERFSESERLARLEVKMWAVLAGVGFAVVELAVLLYRGGVQ